MAFPDTFKGTYQIPILPVEGVLFQNHLLSSIVQNFAFFQPYRITQTDSSVQFHTKSSLLRSEFYVVIKVEVQENFTKVSYEFDTQRIAALSFVAVLASLVFSKMTFGLGFFSSFALIIFLYQLIISNIKSQIIKLLRSCSEYFNEESDVSLELLRKQKEWENEKDRCPACGTKFTVYDKICYSCGLKISETKKLHPSSTTLAHNKRISYQIKQKK